MTTRSALLLCFGLWLLLLDAALALRPPLPVDETRYLAVAWEMWLRGDFLVPYLNGETYSHKPPLLFWLMLDGWSAFGVAEWWPRLVAPLFGLASLFLVPPIARRLWPDRPQIAALAPLVVLGAVFWTLFTTLTMFDMLIAFFTLLGLLGVLKAWREGGRRGFVLLGVAIGLGVLAKGPVILLQTLPVAVLAPLWDTEGTIAARAGGWKRWYLAILAAIALGAAIALAWAVPAAVLGGEAYRNAIFWGQTAGRMVEAFDHARPWWWYLAVTPPLLLPWIIWPPLWRGLFRSRVARGEPGMRFCLVWFIPVFAAFSLISGKQLHYLLPIFPAFALVLTRFLTAKRAAPRGHDQVIPAAFIGLLGVAMVIVPWLPIARLPDWVREMPGWWGLAVLAAALIVARLRPADAAMPVVGLASLSAVLVLSIHLAAAPYLAAAFDLRPLAERLRAWESDGYALANYGKYHGQYHFLGRLHEPISVIGDQEAVEWLAAHPRAKIVTYQNRPRSYPGPQPDLVVPFRSDIIEVWDAETVRGRPDLLKRAG